MEQLTPLSHHPPIGIPIIPAAGVSDGDTASTSMMHESLEVLIRLIEQVTPGMRGSVLILDEDGVTLRHGAAPNLPLEYCRGIDGSKIGPSAGSCGTAAYTRRQVVVGDIATDPLWDDYRNLAIPHGLAACWSTPIIDLDDNVIGTFAMYYDEPRNPEPSDIALTQTAALLAKNIIKRARVAASLRQRTEAAERLVVALHESESKFRHIAEELDAALESARAANKSKSDFLAVMSHELRTPLNAIAGYAQLMLDGIPTPATEQQQVYLQRIMRSQQHLLNLIEAVLTHAKVEAGKITYEIDDVPLHDILETVDPLTAPQRASKRLSYECESCDGSLMLRADREKVVQILLNLLSNAFKFTPEGGKVSMFTQVETPGVVSLTVMDTGIGMVPDQLAMVFEPFVQFDSSLARENKGAGLGMPISRDLARGMGGDLVAASEYGKGSTFTLSLPLASEGQLSSVAR
jgi:signal transduction histidine kinase